MSGQTVQIKTQNSYIIGCTPIKAGRKSTW